MRSRAPPPPLPPDYVPPPRPHSRRGKDWRRYIPDVVERARVLIEGTTWPEAAIAARMGIGVGTVNAWKRKHGWRRPAGTSVSTRKVAPFRAGFTRRCREVLVQVEAMARNEVLRLARDPGADADASRRARDLADAARRALRPPRCARTAE